MPSGPSWNDQVAVSYFFFFLPVFGSSVSVKPEKTPVSGSKLKPGSTRNDALV